MSNPFVAEIRIFPFNFAPKGWAFCDGQILSISQNTALFSLLGTTYGGDGKSNFALPNLQGASPMQQGQGPGLSLRVLGEQGGETNVTLLQTEMPAHKHVVNVDAADLSDTQTPGPLVIFGQANGGFIYGPNTSNIVQMAPSTLSVAGGSLPHNNLMPYLTFNFCIAMQGVYPPRT